MLMPFFINVSSNGIPSIEHINPRARFRKAPAKVKVGYSYLAARGNIWS